MKNRINISFLKKYEKDYYYLNYLNIELHLEYIIKLFIKSNYFLKKNLYNFINVYLIKYLEFLKKIF